MENSQTRVGNALHHESSQEAVEAGMRFKRARENSQLTRNAAAELSNGITASYIFRIEEGKKAPSLSVIQRLADAYGVSMASLLGMDEAREDVIRDIAQRQFISN